ncbi:MAG: hypothetical protein R3D31_07215 [Hyphomicrobiaceae bacterium]
MKQTGISLRVTGSRLLVRAAAVVCVAVGVTGCGMSSLTSGLGSGIWGGKSQQETPVRSVTEDGLLSAAKADTTTISGPGAVQVAHACPRFDVWPRDNTLTVYESGRAGDGLAIVHRGEITKTARECRIEPGRITVKYGFSGRVLLGPRGTSGVVKLPLKVFLTDAKREKVQSDKLTVDVQVALEKPIGYFSAVRTITFTIPEGARPADYQIFVGFERAGAG